MTLRAWATDKSWTCSGRGEISGGVLTFRWIGDQKDWHGVAEVAIVDGCLKGTWLRDAENSGTQYCRGTRVPPKLDASAEK